MEMNLESIVKERTKNRLIVFQDDLAELGTHIQVVNQPLPSDIATYQHPRLKEKMIDRGVVNSEQFDVRFNEFKKYTQLVREFGGPMAMVSKNVDNVWHNFILFTKDYMEYSDKFLGSYLHHNPSVPSDPRKPEGVLRFIQLYNERFGPLDGEVWELDNINKLCSGYCD